MKPDVLLRTDESGWIIAMVPAMPGCVSQGRTEAEAMTNIQEAITAWRLAERLKNADDLLSKP